MPNYNGLTRNQWPGTFSPSSNHPIVLDTEIRGGLRYDRDWETIPYRL